MAVQLLGTKLESFEIMLVMLRNFRGPPYQTNKKLIDYSFEEQYSDWTLAVCCSGSGASRVTLHPFRCTVAGAGAVKALDKLCDRCA